MVNSRHAAENPAFRAAVPRYRSARLLSLISLVRLGVSLGYFEVPYETINALMIGVQRGNLTVRAGADLEAQERDKLRASITREALGKY